MSGAPSWKFFAAMFIVSVVFVVVYKFLMPRFAGMGRIKAGLVYGLCIWAAGLLPGMVVTRAFMTVNPTVIIYWTLMGLVLIPLQGVIAALIIGDETCSVKK